MITPLRMAVYEHSPVWAQSVLCSLNGCLLHRERFGGAFQRWRDFYAAARGWSPSQRGEHQMEQMSLLLRECFGWSSFYSERWKALGLTPADFKDLGDITKFPVTTKEDVFSSVERMVSARVPRSKLIRHTTGGSTGTPLVLYSTREESQKHYAIFWDRMRAGVSLRDRYAAFQGKQIVPASQTLPPFWRENWAANERLYSMRHLAPAMLAAYAESLAGTPFVYYQGYANFMVLVAEHMATQGVALKLPPKAVFSTSDQLTTKGRMLLEETWRTRVYDEYCQSERCALIQECEHRNHHVQMEYGLVEFEPVVRDGDLLLAEMICTGFIPRAAPLIRYRVGDRVLIDESATCPCGQPGPVIKRIDGRASEYLVTPDGRKYPTITHIVDRLRNVFRTQVVQEKPDEMIVRIVTTHAFTKKDEELVVRAFQEAISVDMNVRVQRVHDLERLPNGKVLNIINRLPDGDREILNRIRPQ